MKRNVIFIASILTVLLIPAIDAKPVIIGFDEKIDQSAHRTRHNKLYRLQNN